MFRAIARAIAGPFRRTGENPGARKLAFFADLDNLGADLLPFMLRHLTSTWDVYLRRAYGVKLEPATPVLRQLGITPVQVFPLNHGKNSAHIALVIDAMEQIDHADAFAIAAGDGDYAPLAIRLRERGKFVIALARRHGASAQLKACCNEFIAVDLPPASPPAPAIHAPAGQAIAKSRPAKPTPKADVTPNKDDENENALRLLKDSYEAMVSRRIKPTLRRLCKEHLARHPQFTLKTLRFPKGNPAQLVAPTNFTDFVRSLGAFDMHRVPGTRGDNVDYHLTVKQTPPQ